MKRYLVAARNLPELWEDLENISHDDKKGIEDYSQAEVVAEAAYILSCYHEGGHSFNDDLNSDDPEIYKPAKAEVNGLKAYIKKYGATGASK